MIHVTGEISIDEREVKVRFIRASGPGGQNVNKVSTAVQLRFDVAASTAFDDHVRARLASLAGRRMTSDGLLIIEARRFRSQERNRDDAIARLVALVRRAATPPKPRRKTRVPSGSRKRRVENKVRRGETKRRRGRVRDGDD